MKLVGASIAAAVAGLAIAVGVVAAAANTPARDTAPPPRGKVVAGIPIPDNSGGFAVGEGAVWSTSEAVSVLTRIDPTRNTVASTTKLPPGNRCPELPGSCGEAAVGNGALWLARVSDNLVLRIDPVTSAVVATVRVGSQPEGIAATPGAIWVVNKGGPSVSRIDPATNQVVATIPIGPSSACCSDHMAVAASAGAVWASVPSLNMIVRIDQATNAVVTRIRLPGQPCAFLAADARTVFAAGGHCTGTVVRIDPKTNRAGRPVGGFTAPIGLAIGFGSLWVADLDSKAIDRVDERTGRVVARLRVGGYPVRLGVGFGSVWVRDDTGRVLRVNPQR
jgi:YVTN family beta-propeller protein